MLSTPASNDHLSLAAPDRTGGNRHGIEARSTQSIDSPAGNRFRQSSQEQRHAGNVSIVLAGLVGTAQNHIVDGGRVELGNSGLAEP